MPHIRPFERRSEQQWPRPSALVDLNQEGMNRAGRTEQITDKAPADGPIGIDDAALASLIANDEDLGPVVRQAFETGKPDTLLHQLKAFVKKKEAEIEELCRLHYEEFIHAVDELRYVLVDAEELKAGLGDQNVALQRIGSTTLGKVEELVEAHTMARNLEEAVSGLKACKAVVDLCVEVNQHIARNNYYPALKLLDSLERDHLRQIPARQLQSFLKRRIPACRRHVERQVNKEFNDWLVSIRGMCREIGRQSIAQAQSARQREQELRGRQRQAEEQTRSGQKDGIYVLEVEDISEDDPAIQFDLTPVFRAHYINTCLGLQDHFREYYYKNRLLQLNSDLQFPPGQSFLEGHQPYLAQVAGFFVVEDRVLRTAGGLVTSTQVDNLWENAITKMRSVLEEQFTRMRTYTTLLLVKDNVSLLCATLRRYGYQVAPLLDVLDTTRDRYHDMLLSECRAKISEVLVNDKYEKMVMRKEYEYNMNVLAFRLQPEGGPPPSAFPYVAQFSASVPEICRLVRSFIEDSVSFLAHGAHMDVYDLVKRYLDRLLTNVLNEALLKVIESPSLQVSHAMQLTANMIVLEKACGFFAEHAARLCGMPTRLIEGSHGGLASRGVLRKSQGRAQELMIKLVKSKIDAFISQAEDMNWLPEDPARSASDYVQELRIYLGFVLETAAEILPLDALDKAASSIFTHISDCHVQLLLSEEVKKFNLYAVHSLDADITILEAFAADFQHSSGLDSLHGAVNLKHCFKQARQLMNLLQSNQPELYLDPGVRERNYPALDPPRVAIICDKYKDVSEKSLFGRGSNKMVAKKKSMESLVRKLKEMNLVGGGGGPISH